MEWNHRTMKTALVFLAIAAIGACGKHAGGPVSFGGKKVDNAHFSIEIPNDWQEQPGMEGMVHFVALAPVDSPEDRFRENVNVIIESVGPAVTPELYLQKSKELMASASGLPGYQEVASGDWKDSGFDGRYLEYHQAAQSHKLHGIGYVIVKGEKAYLLTCMAEDSTYDKYLPRFKQVAASFAPK